MDGLHQVKNLLTIAGMYVGNDDMCNDYFDQSIVRRHQSEEVEEEVTEPTL
jgi:hypothetical protein